MGKGKLTRREKQALQQKKTKADARAMLLKMRFFSLKTPTSSGTPKPL
jgi:hypothetical protein